MKHETVEEFLARGGKITVLKPQKIKQALRWAKQGHKHTEFHIGKKKVNHRQYAATVAR